VREGIGSTACGNVGRCVDGELDFGTGAHFNNRQDDDIGLHGVVARPHNRGEPRLALCC
jgi:hypothetical protein